MTKPLAIDLCCGLGGWTEGLIAEGYEAHGFDIEAHEYGEEKYPGTLFLEDVLTIDGARFKNAALIVASPPCQEFSYMAMPWKRATQIARALRGKDEFPAGYKGSRTLAELTALFDACFRIQREACAAAGRHIPMVVENVKGAQPWVGRAKWNFGSYYLWGDVPALMPKAIDGVKVPGMNWSGSDKPGYKAVAFNDEAIRQSRRTAPGKGARFTTIEPAEAKKLGGDWFDGSGKSFQSESVNRHVAEGIKMGDGGWFNDGDNPNHTALMSNKSPARKAAAAKIAKIPFALSSWIARTYKPSAERAA